MLVSLYRLADRCGRIAVKTGLKFGNSMADLAQAMRAAALPRGPAPGRRNGRVYANGHGRANGHANGNGRGALAAPAPVIQVTLTRRQIPAAGLLLAANVGLIVAATLLVDRLIRPNAVAPVPGTLPVPLTPDPALTQEPADLAELAGIDVAVTPLPAGPTLTAPPNPLSLGGTIYYAYRANGFTNLWAHVPGKAQPIRLTAGPWDDRDPAISPDGTRLAFASRRDGYWNLFVLDLTTGETTQLTEGAEFKANPYWSPDGQYLAFEWYRNDNLDIAIVSAQGGDLIALTADLAADYEPAWSPAGREIVWVSMRSGNPDLWRMSLDNPDERRYRQLTDTPDQHEADPVFSPNGEVLAYTDAASAVAVVYTHPALDAGAPAEEAGQGLYPTWAPGGSALATVLVTDGGRDRVLAAPLGQPGLAQIAYQSEHGSIRGLSWSSLALPEPLPAGLQPVAEVADAPLWQEVITTPQPDFGAPPFALVPLEGVQAADPRLSDRVDEAFNGLRRTTARAVGWDFLRQLDNALVELDSPPPPSQDYSSWLKTGRAFDVAQVAEQYGWVKLMREDYGFRTYWRVWLLAAVQDGSQGEPLRRPPWNLAARGSGRPQPYDAGGEYLTVMPPGYFVDFTTLAGDYGWSRVPAESNWRLFYPAILYWRFERRDGLDWLAAMREVYTAAQVATQTPVPSPTNTPTVTNTPTRTITPTRTPTRTPTATNTRWPTWTPTPTQTRRPTITPTPTRTPRPTATPTGTWYTATPTPEPLSTLYAHVPNGTPMPGNDG